MVASPARVVLALPLRPLAIDTDRETSPEAGLKYVIVGGFGSAILLFGSAFVYGATESASPRSPRQAQGTRLFVAGLAMIVAGLAFKVPAAPFHMWTPDVYQGAPSSVTAFMSAATKTAAFVLTMRLLVTAFPDSREIWTIAVAVIACISLAWRNRFAGTGPKRLFAYLVHPPPGSCSSRRRARSVARALLAHPCPACRVVRGLAVVAARERELAAPVTLESLAGLGWERPFYGAALWVFMLGFAGSR